ncbi:MAG: NADH-quinone oxidoreductase subunit N [Thermoleophilia bacterium]|nr:NADH-quinone oxidoreductase subunit N [Thermoleophilia bacterium]GIK76578.1 MAG: NADH-quinone oxidoreductase subunit N [Actinomycetes bacterium]
MIETPAIDYGALSPIIALVAGICVVLLVGLIGPRGRRGLSSALTLATLAAAAGLLVWQLGEPDADLVAGALRSDGLSITIGLIVVAAAALVVPLQLRDPAAEEAGFGETHTLLLGSVLGMLLLAEAQNLISFFVALELLSIPLYVLCGSHRSRSRSLESGLKYLIVGSIGSATLLYGSAFIYGGSGGATDFTAIAQGIGADLADDPLVLIGIALVAVGLAFKVSIAPFHQWTPDVYEGAPTPITAFMAVATKAAAFAVFARFFITALGPSADQWQPALAALAAVTIVVGNVGALGQDSLKRLLGYSGVAQAGYMLTGLLLGTVKGIDALVFYLAAYMLINMAAFAVIAVRERETAYGDDITAVQGIGKDRPALAWSLTISMLALAGLPGTAGFIGKLFLIEAAVAGNYTWLGVFIVVGSMISLVYYLRVVAAIWMRPAPRLAPAMAGASTEAAGEPGLPRRTGEPGRTPSGAPSGGRCWLVLGAILAATAATVAFGIVPSPLIDFSAHAGEGLASMLGPG